MPTKALALAACAIGIALTSSAGAAAPQELSPTGGPEHTAASTIPLPAPRTYPRLVRIPDPVARRATLSALETAVARFERPDCSLILLDFADRGGRPLQQ